MIGTGPLRSPREDVMINGSVKQPIVALLILACFGFGGTNASSTAAEIEIPNIEGYRTLKCDFHIHTIFSDGNVWPNIRVHEAKREGLDVIAITDHLTHSLLWKSGIVEKDSADFNLSSQLARKSAEGHGITIIQGAEITREMPPGHLNALFLQDANQLDPRENPDWKTALQRTHEQGAFVFWNHPRGPDGRALWYDEHTAIYENGWLHGIEVVNGSTYSPEAHAWCIEKQLTMVGNSDIHGVTAMSLERSGDEHRTMTLVFSRENSAAAIREALVARRTAIYTGNTLIGEAEYLKAIFENSLEMEIGKNKQLRYVHATNSSSIDYALTIIGKAAVSNTAGDIVLVAGRSTSFVVRLDSDEGELPCIVRNLVVAPGRQLRVDLMKLSTQKQ
jgi:hypothetical protein